MAGPREVARVVLPTPFGEFDAHAFECSGGYVHVALVKGDLASGGGTDGAGGSNGGTGSSVLTRLHSECLTGDALGSLRCDCGVQLRLALRLIAAEGRGVLVYLAGHEGRGIGLLNKLRAYAEQDAGADTLEANVRLGLPVDARRYGEAGAVLTALGVRSVRLMTNNPAKVAGLEEAGVAVAETVPLATAPHGRNLAYLRTKRERLGHLLTWPGPDAGDGNGNGLPAVDVDALLGPCEPPVDRPFVVLKYAQTLDGRIATATGDSKWISGEAERRVSHGLRATCDAICVGVGTVLRDDPQLTVRMVPGASPLRVVLDSTLRTPPDAQILSGDAGTVILTTDRSSAERRRVLRDSTAGVHVVPAGSAGVDLKAALGWLRNFGVRSLLVEGGARVITSMLLSGVVDRLIVAVAPVIIGRGTEAVGQLGIARVTDGIRLANRRVHVVDDDLLVGWDVGARDGAEAPCSVGADGRPS